eukprot:ANDGO_07391.mRNA.1 Bifunctional dTDP-4-dehydrorhamnose 3
MSDSNYAFVPSNICGLGVWRRKIHRDSRGMVNEFYRQSVIGTSTGDVFPCVQITHSVSQKGVLRGFHCSPYWKVIVCAAGSIQDVCIDFRPDSPSYLQVWSGVFKGADGDRFIVPPGIGHGFLALEDKSEVVYMQSGEYSAEGDIEISVFDPLAIDQWNYCAAGLSSIRHAIISPKDLNNPMFEQVAPRLKNWVLHVPRLVDCVLIGSKGYIGSVFLDHLKESNLSVLIYDERLEHRSEIQRMLDSCKPKYVVCCAGIAGKPNIDWCLTHVPETVDSNVVCQVALAEDCRRRNIHCTLILTGALYDSRVLDKVYCEDDMPNCPDHVYYKLRTIEEELLRLGGHDKHLLGLRTLYPITGDLHERSLTTKLTKFSKIMRTTTSVTVLDELVPAAIQMMMRNVTGIFNFVNPGAISFDEIMEMYKEIVEPNATWVSVDPTPEQKRASCVLDTVKLMASFEGASHVVHDTKTAVRSALLRIRSLKNKQT